MPTSCCSRRSRASWKLELAKRFEKQYPHQIFRIHSRAAGGLAVLSKHEIKAEELFASPNAGWFPAERLVLDTPLGKLQVLHLHLRPAVDGGSWIKGFMTTPPLRRREIEATGSTSRAICRPSSQATSTKTRPAARSHSSRSRGCRARRRSGPTTWHYVVDESRQEERLLKLDIDHVMVDKRLSTRDGTVLDAGHSDHRPVIVTIEPR